MLHHGVLVVSWDDDADDVETAGLVLELAIVQEPLGGLEQAALFAAIDRVLRISEGIAVARLDLDEDHGLAVPHNEIELARRCYIPTGEHA